MDLFREKHSPQAVWATSEGKRGLKQSVWMMPPKRMGDRSVCHNSLGAVKKVLLPKNLDDKIVPHDRLYKLLGSW